MKEEILKLKHGECYIVPESDYGKAEIHRIHQAYFLFEIPQFGGEPMYKYYFRVGEEEAMLKSISSWS